MRRGVAARAAVSTIVGLAIATGGCAVRVNDSGDGRGSSPRTTRRAVQRPRPIAAAQPATAPHEAWHPEAPPEPWGEEPARGGWAAEMAPPLLSSEEIRPGGGDGEPQGEGANAGVAYASSATGAIAADPLTASDYDYDDGGGVATPSAPARPVPPTVVVRREEPGPAPEPPADPSVEIERHRGKPVRAAAAPAITVTREEIGEDAEDDETIAQAHAVERAVATQAGYWVVMSRYRAADQAAVQARQVRLEGFPARSGPLTMNGEVWYGVSVGPYETERDAVIAGQGLRARGYGAWMVEAARQ